MGHDGPAAPGPLLTARLDLRPVAAGDLAPLHRMAADPRNSEFMPEGADDSPESTLAWIDRFAGRWEASGLGYWTVRLRAGGEVIGVGGADRRQSSWNLLYRLDPAHRGFGYATELALAAQRAAASADRGLPLVAWIHRDNTASRAVAARIGLRDHGLRFPEHWDGEPMHYWADRAPGPSRTG